MPGKENHSTRRTLLLSAAAFAGLAVVGFVAREANGNIIVTKPGKVEIALFAESGEPIGVKMLDKVIKSDEAWREGLPGIAFRVARQNGTERAFSGPYWDSHDEGLYRCVGCEAALFSSDAKYDSGTGWPSFRQPIAGQNITELVDRSFGLARTGLSCARCDSHLGHVFTDGPPPTGLRYCINGVSLKFVPLVSA